jgi:hypothetical protein
VKGASYSGTPLARKLGVQPGSRPFVRRAPKNHLQLVATLPSGGKVVARIDASTDIVHIFAPTRAVLAMACAGVLFKLKDDGAIWVSWPKRTSAVNTDVTDSVGRETALPMGSVGINAGAVDEVWSGLNLVLRKENHGRPPPSASPDSHKNLRCA